MVWAVIGILAVWLFYHKFAANKGVHAVTIEELKGLLDEKNRQYIDVRTPNEFSRNHIKGFKNIPLSELQHRMGELSFDRELVVICQSGLRSAKACQRLKKAGFEQVTNVKGGMGNHRGQ